jgi:glycosyltransferase involved in cell wall biosynthesis
MPSVSIIIPMYNEERYIARCLESLTHQSFQNFEIILIDDGSTDKTVKIAETFKSSFLLTILHQKHA